MKQKGLLKSCYRTLISRNQFVSNNYFTTLLSIIKHHGQKQTNNCPQKREIKGGVNQIMEEFNLQTEKTTKFTQQEFVAVSPLSSRSCNKENNKKSWVLLCQM